MEKTKKCKECKEVKLVTEFYGVQGECKICTKKRVRRREKELRKNPDWIKKERQRQREKYHRLDYKEKHKPTPEQKKKQIERFKKKYPEKLNARNKSSNLKPKVKGNILHHWSYNEEHVKDVIELSKSVHYKLHRFLKYDKKTFMFKTLNGVLLDTKEKHLEYLNKVKNLD